MRVWLFEAETQSFAEASLIPMASQHVSQARRSWVDAFHRRRSLFICDDDFMVWNHGVMSEGSIAAGHVPHGSVVVCEGEVQGVVVFDEQLQPSRRRPGTHLLYLTYLATAPWNRPNGEFTGRFRQVGRMLVAQSVRESIALGCPGRIGLHSYQASSDFYEKLHFDKLGSDASRRGMCYLELRAGAAFSLLSDFGRPQERSPSDR